MPFIIILILYKICAKTHNKVQFLWNYFFASMREMVCQFLYLGCGPQTQSKNDVKFISVGFSNREK